MASENIAEKNRRQAILFHFMLVRLMKYDRILIEK